MAKRTVRKNNKSCNKNIKYIKLDNLSKDEQAFVGYNPNNPRGNVDSSKSVYSISTFLVEKINNTNCNINEVPSSTSFFLSLKFLTKFKNSLYQFQ